MAVFPAAGYMSLAVEALHQIHEAYVLPFEGVTLRDINIKTALVIPETDDGVEIQVHLQRVADTTDKGSWHMFVVESLVDGHWSTHCDGMIGANINVKPTEKDYTTPVTLSKLTQRVPGKRWYDAFSRVGFDYRGSFQQLHRIRSNRKHNQAAADVSIQDTSGTMQGESRYVIHPATVDACLQLIIISIHAGLHKDMPWGVVPIRVNEVSFWFPQDNLGSIGNSVAWTDTLEARYFNTHAKLMGANGNLIMDVKNLRCVAYEAAVPPMTSSLAASQPYMQSSWKPDFSTLSPTELAEHCDSPVVIDSVRKLVELLDHKHGLMDVILLGRPSQNSLDTLLQGLSANVSITIGYTRSENMESHEPFDKEDPRVSTFLIPKDSKGWETLSLSTPDLVLVHEDTIELGIHQDTFRMLKGVADERGWMVIFTTPARCNVLTTSISSCGWSVSVLRLNSEYHILLCNAKSNATQAPDRLHNLTVLRLDDDVGLCDELLEALRASRLNVNIKLMQDFNASTDKHIVLPDKAHQILANTKDDSFEALQAVLCAPVSILWLVKGVKEGSSTAGGMVEGFLRVIRSEQAAARIALLDYDSDEQVEKIRQAVLTCLHKAAPKESGEDMEFWLHHGVLHVNRITANESLSSQIHGPSNKPKIERLTADTPLVGSIENGQIVFRPDMSEELAALGDDQVAIQVNFSEPTTSARASALVLGTVLHTGSNIESCSVGKDVVAYANASFHTIIRTSVWAPAPPNLDPGDVLASLIPLCPAVNASISTAKARSQEWLLLLPAPLELMYAYIRLSQVLKWKITVVAHDDLEKQTYVSKFNLKPETVLNAVHVKTIIEIVQLHPTNSPCVVVAHEFSSLSKEVWRSIKPLGRFILNETSIEGSLDVLPFSRGASFLTARISDLACQDVQGARDLLKLTVSLFTEHHQRLVIMATSRDIGTIQITHSNHAEGDVIAYNYQQSLVQVRTIRGSQQ